MRQLRVLTLLVLACALFSVPALKAQTQASAVRIVNPIDEKHLVTLKGFTHPLANAKNDRGAAADDMPLERMHLTLKRSASQDAALSQLINEMHRPGSASYHKWLTPEQFGTQFGPSDEDIATVSTWLTSHGFNVAKVNPGKLTLEFSGNVGQFRSAFHAQIHKYEVNGETHYSNSSDPQIPEAIAPVVGGFVSLNNFRAKSHLKTLGEANYDPKTGKATPLWTTGSSNNLNFVLSPADYAVQYDLPAASSGITGAGQTIAIINESNINIARVNAFRTLFGLSANPPQVIIDGNDPGVDGINNPDGENGASVEAYLDVEWSGAVAPDATIDLVVAGDTALESGLFLAMEHTVYGNIAPVVSISFGFCEAGLGSTNAFLSNLWEQAAAQGITVMVSAGDSGSAGCDDDNSQDYAFEGQAVSGYASTPYDVAVGGTDFYYTQYPNGIAAVETQLPTYWGETVSNSTPAVSIKTVIPEQPWNDSQYGLTFATLDAGTASPQTTTIAAGSGGASNAAINTNSAGYPKPAWQSGAGVPADGVRDLPDVSLFASNGSNASYYPICATDGDCQPVASGGTVQIFGVGGTSASSPAFAGIMALVNQKYGPQGQADFVLYPLKAQYPAAFHDVVHGTNSVPCDLTDFTPDCIAAAIPITDTDGTLEGQIGTGTTPEYNATAGYNLATGLGTIDANVLVTDWNKITFAKSATTVTVTPANSVALNAIPHGTAVTFSGAVTGTGIPSGDVSILASSTEAGQQAQGLFTLSSGAYTGSISTLPGGSYNVWAQYGGDTANALSNSTPVAITVDSETSGIDFNVLNPTSAGISAVPSGTTNIDYGTQLVLDAEVAPSSELAALESCLSGSTTCPTFTPPTGTVTFSDAVNGGTASAINTTAINAEGDAEYNAPFAVGSHSVTAAFNGDGSYKASTAAAIGFTVVKDTPQIIVNASNYIQLYGYVGAQNEPTVLVVQVENGAVLNASGSSIFPVSIAPPTGTVTVSGLPSGVPSSATLNPAVDPTTGAPEGVAIFTIPASASSATYTIGINYPGDSNYALTSLTGGTIQIIGQTQGLVSTTAASMTGSLSPDSTITITGTVTGQSGQAAPTGYVGFFASGYSPGAILITPRATGDISDFSFSIGSQDLFQGANFATLQYYGDNTYYPSDIVLNSGSPISNPLSDFTLIPTTTIEGITPTSSPVNTINLTSVNGFNGTVALTCSATPGITCLVTPSVTLAGGGSATATLGISTGQYTPNGSYNVLVTGKDATGEYVHTLGITAVVTGSTVGSTSFSLSNSGNLTVDAGVNIGNTSTITVTPIGGFTGTVDVACVVSPAGADSPTCGLASPSVTFGSTAQTDVLTVTTTASTASGSYTVTVTGTSGSIAPTTVVNVAVSLPSFTLPAASSLSLTAGATTGNTASITVTPTNGFTGAVTLTCALTSSPAGATDPATCSIGNVTISGTTAQTATLTINSTAPTTTTTMNQEKKFFWPTAGGTALALIFLFGIPAKRRKWLALFGLLFVLATGAVVGCGGGGGGGCTSNCTTTSGGTTTGAYVFTVTATSGSMAPTTTVTANITN